MTDWTAVSPKKNGTKIMITTKAHLKLFSLFHLYVDLSSESVDNMESEDSNRSPVILADFYVMFLVYPDNFRLTIAPYGLISFGDPKKKVV